jgi:streptomycin 6-kinase
MKAAVIQIPGRVRRRAIGIGGAGVAWLAGLDGLVRNLATEWHLSIGRTSSGTESFVAAVRTAEGQDAVLKIAIPGLDPTASELRTLLAAQGRGYAKVFRHDAARGAMLLERLGPQLNELGLPIDTRRALFCANHRDGFKFRGGPAPGL